MDLGATTVFIYTFQERETIYNLHEAFCGTRITNSATRIGGMIADLPAGWVEFAHELEAAGASAQDERFRRSCPDA